MPHTKANGIEINFDEVGDGDPLVLVHGGWSDRNNCLSVIPALSESFRMAAYDRRGHGHSQRDAIGTRRDQEDDLAGLIEALGGKAHVVGTSFGGSIGVGLASRRPELVSGLIVHEPPLMSIAAEDPENWAQLGAIAVTVQEVVALVEEGRALDAAHKFVEEVALGAGAWGLLPPPLRETMVDGAASFVAEQQDVEWANVDLADLAMISCPVLVTDGDESPPWFRLIASRLGEAIPGSATHTYRGGGHAPHLTHPEDYLSVVGEFLWYRAAREAETAIAAS